MKNISLAKRAIIAVVSGAMTTLAFAPFNWFVLALITPAILFLLLRELSVKNACFIGWLYGLGFFGTGVSWVYVSIHTYGNVHAILAGTLTFLFCAALALLFFIQTWLFQRYFSKRYSAVSFGALWLLFEWSRSWFLTGFPWLFLGYSSIDTPISPLASLGGVWLNSAIIIVLSLSLASYVANRNKQSLVVGFSTLAAALLVSNFIPKDWTSPSGDPIDIAIVQPNIPQEIKWDSRNLKEILTNYYKSSEPLIGKRVIIWPETAIPSLYSSVEGFLAPLVKAQKAAGGSLISGIPTKVADAEHPLGRRIHNSIFNLTQNTIYHKQRLVPFGEYVPLQEHFRDLFNFLNIPDLTFSLPKKTPQPLMRVGKYKFSTAICYEITYPELVRQYSKEADIILTLSNDTWFSHSIGPDQHYQIARMRAIENGRWLVRSSNNGISAIVSPQGKTVKMAPRYVQAILEAKVQPLQGLTPYQRIGQWPLIISYFLILFLVLAGNRKRATPQS